MTGELKDKPIRAVIDCPVCFSGNTFYLNTSIPPLDCEDCGFTLSNAVDLINDGICIFCGNDKFYVEAPLIFKFLESLIICYVCEAQYNGTEIAAADDGFDEQTAEVLKRSPAAVDFKERAARWN